MFSTKQLFTYSDTLLGCVSLLAGLFQNEFNNRF